MTRIVNAADDFVWGLPLICLILFGGVWLTLRLRGMSLLQLPRALGYMLRNEPGGKGEVSSFAALCTALSATVGTGNIVGVATAYVTGGPGAIFWLYIAAVFIGPYMTISAVWGIADIVNGLMAVPNMIALIVLSGVVVRETNDYFARLRRGELRG